MNNKKMIKDTVKKHIPQRHLTSVRIMYRIAMETIYGINRTGLINIAIIALLRKNSLLSQIPVTNSCNKIIMPTQI